MKNAALSVQDLTLETRSGLRIVDGVNLHIPCGSIAGLVGESGSGKSQMALAVAGLSPPAITRKSGTIKLGDLELSSFDEAALRAVRGSKIAYIFQEPMNALNPTKRIGRQLVDVICQHRPLKETKAIGLAREMLDQVGMRDPDRVLGSYPFQLSGGMRQRVLIAAAFMCNPELVIADEPTTALDVTIQAQVIDLLAQMVRDRGTSVLLISHNLALVSQVCTSIFVMRSGKIVEAGPTTDVIGRPRHDYTKLLLQSVLDTDLLT